MSEEEEREGKAREGRKCEGGKEGGGGRDLCEMEGEGRLASPALPAQPQKVLIVK